VISVLIPTTGHRPVLLAEAMASAVAQVPAVDVVVEHDTWRTGLSATVNRAARVARGDYLTILSDDDYYLGPTVLQTLRDALDAHPAAGVAYSLPRYVDADGGPRWTPTRPAAWLRAHPVVTWDSLVDGLHIHGIGLLYRRDWWERAGQWDESLPCCEEWEYHLRLLWRGCAFLGVPVETVAYRVHPGQKSARRSAGYGRRSVNRLAVRRQIRDRYATMRRTA